VSDTSPTVADRTNPVLAERNHPLVADRSKLAAVCIDMGSVVVDERPTWSH